MARPRKLTPEVLNAALVGLAAQQQRIDAQIGEVRRMLGGRPARAVATAPGVAPKKRTMSAAGRKRIAAAQKKRWREFHKKTEGTPATAKAITKTKGPKKRRLSAAGRRAIIAATKKRWAAVRAAKSQQAKTAAKRPALKRAAVKKVVAKKSAKAAPVKRAAKKTASVAAQAAPETGARW